MAEQLQTGSDTQSQVILAMERKLNPQAFWRRLWKNDKYCKITTAQYWDWITYLDVSSDSLIIYV